MKNDIGKSVETLLNDASGLAEFANFNRIAPDASKDLLERMMKEPEISQAAQDFISSPNRSEDFKAFNAGESKGFAQGHEAGFAKGAMVATLAVASSIVAIGLAYLFKRD